MNLLIRKIAFYFLVLVFLVLLPILLLFALGYRWDPVSHVLTQAGIINFKTVPEGAQIIVNGKVSRQKTPASLALLPGTYDVKLDLKDYWPYSKKVEVRANKVLRLENILLFPKTPRVKFVTTLPELKTFFLSPSGKRVLFISHTPKGETLYVLHVGDKTLRELVTLPASPSLNMEKAEVAWSADEEAALVTGKDLFYLLFLKQPQESYFLKDVLGSDPQLVKFSRRHASSLYFLDKGKLHRFDIKKKEIEALPPESVADFQPTSSGFLWIQEGSVQVLSSEDEGKTSKPAGSLRNARNSYPLLWDSSVKPFLSFASERWAALDRSGNFYVLEPAFYRSGMKGFRFSPSGDKIVLWNDYEIWLLEEKAPAKGGSGVPQLKRRLVFESEVPLKGVFWSSEENYIFFLTHRKLYALELNAEGGANLYPFYLSKYPFLPRGWAVDEEEGLLYWTTTFKDERQFRVLRLSVGFLEPIVTQMEQVRKEVDLWKEKLQTP